MKVLLDWGHRHGTLPGLPANAVIYEEEVSRPADHLPLFIPEFVMNQLESDANLARLPNPTVRHLVVLLMETGLRGGDACTLPFNPIVEDSVGWPCLRFDNAKVRPNSSSRSAPRRRHAIRAQQAPRARSLARRLALAVPRHRAEPRRHQGLRRTARSRHSSATGRRRSTCATRPASPSRVHAHQFRHTVGTRLINAGVPQHVDPEAARPRQPADDRPLRPDPRPHRPRRLRALLRQRVNIAGEHLDYDPDAVTADAEWVKHNLARVRDSLPNGYCGRPPQQDCPHPNACLTCPDFQTTPEFLDIHRRQADTNRQLIARADADGQFRLADNLRQVQDSLDRIIPALEALGDDRQP